MQQYAILAESVVNVCIRPNQMTNGLGSTLILLPLLYLLAPTLFMIRETSPTMKHALIIEHQHLTRLKLVFPRILAGMRRKSLYFLPRE